MFRSLKTVSREYRNGKRVEVGVASLKHYSGIVLRGEHWETNSAWPFSGLRHEATLCPRISSERPPKCEFCDVQMTAYVDKINYSQIWASPEAQCRDEDGVTPTAPNLYRSNSKRGCLNDSNRLPPVQEDMKHTGTGESWPLSFVVPWLYAYSFELLNVPDGKRRSFSPSQKLLQ